MQLSTAKPRLLTYLEDFLGPLIDKNPQDRNSAASLDHLTGAGRRHRSGSSSKNNAQIGGSGLHRPDRVHRTHEPTDFDLNGHVSGWRITRPAVAPEQPPPRAPSR